MYIDYRSFKDAFGYYLLSLIFMSNKKYRKRKKKYIWPPTKVPSTICLLILNMGVSTRTTMVGIKKMTKNDKREIKKLYI